MGRVDPLIDATVLVEPCWQAKRHLSTTDRYLAGLLPDPPKPCRLSGTGLPDLPGRCRLNGNGLPDLPRRGLVNGARLPDLPKPCRVSGNGLPDMAFGKRSAGVRVVEAGLEEWELVAKVRRAESTNTHMRLMLVLMAC